MRIALFGGTFDPPHRGHLAIARAAADTFGLNSVLFAPVGRQPLKLTQAPTPFADRLQMVTLACADQADPRFIVSTVDAPHPDGSPNYTVDALTQLAAQFPAAAFFSIIGADSFGSISRWKDPQRLLSLAQWIVVSRPGFPLLPPDDLNLCQRERIHLLDAVHDDLSATTLRTRLTAGEPCPDLIAPSVDRYIRQHNLYSSSTPTHSLHQ